MWMIHDVMDSIGMNQLLPHGMWMRVVVWGDMPWWWWQSELMMISWSICIIFCNSNVDVWWVYISDLYYVSGYRAQSFSKHHRFTLTMPLELSFPFVIIRLIVSYAQLCLGPWPSTWQCWLVQSVSSTSWRYVSHFWVIKDTRSRASYIFANTIEIRFQLFGLLSFSKRYSTVRVSKKLK